MIIMIMNLNINYLEEDKGIYNKYYFLKKRTFIKDKEKD